MVWDLFNRLLGGWSLSCLPIEARYVKGSWAAELSQQVEVLVTAKPLDSHGGGREPKVIL